MVPLYADAIHDEHSFALPVTPGKRRHCWCMGVCVLYSNFPYLASTHRRLSCSYTAWMPFGLLAAATKDIYVSTTVILLSEVAIFLLGPANHPELHLSVKELKAVKPRMYVRQAIVFLVYVVALLMHQGMIASCIAMATFAVAVLLAIAHVDDGEIHRFKKEQANPKEVIRNHE